jgi:hypothetical protein
MRHFAGEGHDPRPLAAGVEGAIYDLGGGLVAKVWRDRRPAGLVRMQSFYADVGAAGLPFRTPEILAVEQVDGRSVTYERKLPGEPLARRLGDGDDGLDPVAARCRRGAFTPDGSDGHFAWCIGQLRRPDITGLLNATRVR